MVFAAVVFLPKVKPAFFAPRTAPIIEGPVPMESPVSTPAKSDKVTVTNLEIPWEVVRLPNGSLLFTERPGRLKIYDTQTKLVQNIDGVSHTGEGGLLGLALHPDFSKNSFVYLYSTFKGDKGLENRVERYKFDGDRITDKKVIISGIKGSSNHDGGRIKFGPDGYLYITTGDGESPDSAQDTSSLSGKILRVGDGGEIPKDNPFGNAVYSFGHRNPQGLAWDNKGNLWETEHGPSGSQTGNDEVNLIVKGGNYGWPQIRGKEKKEGMITPVIESGKGDTWAPSGLAYKDGYLYFAGLRGQTLYKAKIENESSLVLSKHLQNTYGRLRTVVIDGDNLLVATSNKDGRGKPTANDDKIISVSLSSI